MTEIPFSVDGVRVTVVGAQRSGVAAARLLAQRGARVTVTDAQAVMPGRAGLEALGVRVYLEAPALAGDAQPELVVLSPGVPRELPAIAAAIAHGIPVIGELELAARWLRGPLIAITGTKGKSTTTTLVGRMLQQDARQVLVGGNIGVPLSAHVDASTAETVHVVEVSSFQLETTVSFRPWIAALLNLSADHLDRHPDFASYARAKARIFANQQATDWAVLNADDEEAQRLAEGTPATRCCFGITRTDRADVFAAREVIWQRTSEGLLPLVALSVSELRGRHMLGNVVAAAAICRTAGAAPEAIERGLQGFRGLEHVMEPVATIGGVRFINDSKATNVEAAARSIESFDGVVAIVGGRYKGGDFRDLRAPLTRHAVAVVAIGEARTLVRTALAGTVPCVDAASMVEAVGVAAGLAPAEGVVLLAPACSSFDMFANYAERGQQFKAAVEELRVRNKERSTKNEERNEERRTKHGTKNDERVEP